MFGTLKPNCVLNLVSNAVYTFKNMTNELFFPVKAFDPGLNLLELNLLELSHEDQRKEDQACVSQKARKLYGPEKPFIKLRPAYSVKLVFLYVVKGIKIKITAKFCDTEHFRFEDAKRIISPEKFRVFRETGPRYNIDQNSRAVQKRNKMQLVVYSLEQSGKRLVGLQFPFDPQTQIDTSKGWAKSDLLLQKGEQNVPNNQSSQAFAPPLGGGKSLHFFAVRVKKVMNINLLLFLYILSDGLLLRVLFNIGR